MSADVSPRLPRPRSPRSATSPPPPRRRRARNPRRERRTRQGQITMCNTLCHPRPTLRAADRTARRTGRSSSSCSVASTPYVLCCASPRRSCVRRGRKRWRVASVDSSARTQNGHIRNDTPDASRRILGGSVGPICRENRVARDRACTCVTLRNLHGKEGVDGSSPSEGSAKAPHTRLLFSDRLADSRTWPRYGALYGAFRSRKPHGCR